MSLVTNSAAGLGGFANTPLAQLYLYDKIMDNYYEHDFLFEITNSEIKERIESCSQEVQIIMPVNVGTWRSYTPGQEMTHDTVTFTAKKLSICHAAYIALEFDELTLHYVCDWERYEEKLLEGCYERFVDHQRRFVFSDLIARVDPRNRGNHAGLYGNYMLGETGTPVRVTPSNVMLFLGNLQAVLKEHLHWITSGMYLLVPVEMRPILMLSQYANQSWSGLSGPTTNITGLLSHDLNGFTVYETVHLPSTMENGSRCYYIIAGHKDAYAYAADIIGERISKTPKTWSIMYQMLAVWGGAMLFPEFVALGYVTFDAELSLT